MKKSFMTRVLATGLSLAMALSLSTATNLVSAQAAPAMLVDAVSGESTSTLTVDVDTVAKLKINPEVSKTYKVESVKKSSKKIKTAVNKKGTVVYVRGMAATGEKDSAIRVYFKVKKTGKTAKRQFTAKVKVVEKEAPKPTCVKLIGAAQKEAKKIAVKFDNKVETPGALSITRTEGNVVVPVKSVAYDTDKTGATIELYSGLTDAKEYTVTYVDVDEAKTSTTATFTSTDNKVADIKLDTTSIVAKVASEIKIKTYDAKEVLLNEYKLTEAEANKMTIEVKSSNNTGYRAGDTVYVAAVGDTLNIKVTLHTFDYVDGKEQNTIERSFDVVGTTEDYAKITYGYSLAKNQPNFDSASYKQNTAVSLSESGWKVYFNFKSGTTNKNDLFTVESSDQSVAVMASTPLKGALNYGVDIKPVKEGSAYIIVKDADKNVVTTLPFTVGPKSKATEIKLSATSVTTSDVTGVENETVKVKVKDQYDSELTIKTLKVEPTDTATAVSAKAITTPDSEAKKERTITIDGTQARARKDISYAYKVTAETDQGNLTAYLNVTILNGSKNTEASSYKVVLSKYSTDLAVNYTETATRDAIELRVGKYNNAGALVGYVDLVASQAAITCVSTDDQKTLSVVSGDAYSRATTIGAFVTKAVSKSALIATAVDAQTGNDAVFNKIATAGKTYRVNVTLTGKDGKKVVLSPVTFDVTDSQAKFTFKVAKTDKLTGVTAGDLKTTLTAVADGNVTYYANGDKIAPGDIDISSVDFVPGNKIAAIKSVTFAYTIHDPDTTAYKRVFVTATPDQGSEVVMTQP